MNFFSVSQCGLYHNSSDVSHGLDMAETFQLIANWVANKSLAETLPWDVDARDTGAKCYCHDLYKSEETGDYLFVLWKSDSGNNGSIWGAPEDQPTGQGKVVEYTNAYRGKKVVWGRPCYYWIVPSLNTIVSIKFDHSVCDSNLFQEWVAACITARVQHPNKRKEYTEQGLVRLSFTDGTESGHYRYRYGFDMGLQSMDTGDGRIIELASKITHIIRRQTITIKPKDEREDWVKIFDNVPFIKTRNESKKRQIEIKAEAQPTPEEVKAIIEKFAVEGRRKFDWDNVGFSTKDHETIWVDRYRLKNTVEYNHDKGVIPAFALFERLEKNRDVYLGPVIRERDKSTKIQAAKSARVKRTKKIPPIVKTSAK